MMKWMTLISVEGLAENGEPEATLFVEAPFANVLAQTEREPRSTTDGLDSHRRNWEMTGILGRTVTTPGVCPLGPPRYTRKGTASSAPAIQLRTDQACGEGRHVLCHPVPGSAVCVGGIAVPSPRDAVGDRKPALLRRPSAAAESRPFPTPYGPRGRGSAPRSVGWGADPRSTASERASSPASPRQHGKADDLAGDEGVPELGRAARRIACKIIIQASMTVSNSPPSVIKPQDRVSFPRLAPLKPLKPGEAGPPGSGGRRTESQPSCRRDKRADDIRDISSTKLQLLVRATS
ncbi:hypothetical protein B2J93_4893 [Marssonina coronariae]|uniref:Uncharacterized protein n=1 Tax=Diplocarpon coronariae TaxID=2795749 RepID=A0A218ZA66_9HELO|nr:hypothetical protein B2J93_4893 [Marssonina coronariae]